MSYETLMYDVDQGVGMVTFNRPAVLNAINPPMIEELQDVFNAVRDDAHVRAVVLTGAGRGFCSGADLKARPRVKPGEAGPEASKASAERLARGPTRAIGLCKRTLNIGVTADLVTTLDAEAEGQGLASQTEDHWEGVQAFLEKRPARFSGQ